MSIDWKESTFLDTPIWRAQTGKTSFVITCHHSYNGMYLIVGDYSEMEAGWYVCLNNDRDLLNIRRVFHKTLEEAKAYAAHLLNVELPELLKLVKR